MKAKKRVKLGNLRDIGVDNIKSFIRNSEEINKRIESSRKSDCYIESISLQLQKIDIWLRMLIHRKTKKKPSRKIYFGTLIEMAKKFLPPKLYKKLKDFNENRVIAIHQYIYGVSSYEEIKRVADKFKDFHLEVFGFVVDDARGSN